MTINLKYRILFGLLFLFLGFFICAISLKMMLGKSYLFIASEFYNAGNDLKIESMANKAINADSDLQFANFYIGSLYRKQNRYKEAEPLMLKALKYTTHPANVLRELGSIYFSTKMYFNSIQSYERSFKMDNRPAVLPGMLYYNFGKAAYYTKNYSKALYGLYKSLYLNYSTEYIYPVLSEIYLIFNLPERALYFAKLDFLKNPQNTDKQQKYFQLFVKNKSYEIGVAVFKSLYEKSLLDVKGINFYITLLYLNKNYEEALKILKIAEKEFPDNPALLLLFGRTYEALNMKKEMRDYYLKFLEKDPKASMRNEILKKLKDE